MQSIASDWKSADELLAQHADDIPSFDKFAPRPTLYQLSHQKQLYNCNCTVLHKEFLRIDNSAVRIIRLPAASSLGVKTGIEQGATEAAVAGDDEPAVPQPAVPEPSVPKHSKAKKMKRPAAASSIASSKRPKGSAQIECEDVTAAPMPEVSQRDDLLVAVAEPEASERDDLPAAVAEPEASFKDDLPTVVPCEAKGES